MTPGRRRSYKESININLKKSFSPARGARILAASCAGLLFATTLLTGNAQAAGRNGRGGGSGCHSKEFKLVALHNGNIDVCSGIKADDGGNVTEFWGTAGKDPNLAMPAADWQFTVDLIAKNNRTVLHLEKEFHNSKLGDYALIPFKLSQTVPPGTIGHDVELDRVCATLHHDRPANAPAPYDYGAFDVQHCFLIKP